MLKAIGKWAVKKAAGCVVGTIVALAGGSERTQEIATVATELSVAELLGD